MAKAIYKGSEYNNINETWDQNERKREKGNAPGTDGAISSKRENDLEKVIREEATEYDNVNKEERILGGERATINDEPTDTGSDV
jgi:hypothetical protein